MKFEMKTKALRFLSDIQTGPFGSQLHKEDYVDDGTPIVTVEHLGNRVFTEQNLPRVSNEDKQRLSKYILKEGDIVSFDVGTVYEGFYGDAARTFAVGDVSPEAGPVGGVPRGSQAQAVAAARTA